MFVAGATPLPSGNVWRGSHIDAIVYGNGDKDWSIMGCVRARSSGIKE